MVGQRRGVVAGIVGRHDDVALGCEHGRENQALAVARGGQIGNVEILVRRRAVGIHDDRSRSLTSCIRPRRHHQRAGSGRGLALRADRLVLQLIHVDGTGRRVRDRDQLLTEAVEAQLRQKIGGRVRTHLGGRNGQQLAARGSGLHRWRAGSGVVAVVVSAADQDCQGRQHGQRNECAHREQRNSRAGGRFYFARRIRRRRGAALARACSV